MPIVPFIDIVPIGPAGSGKTCLLAAMKQGLDTYSSDAVPVLGADPTTTLRLDHTWGGVRADGSGWPAATDRDAWAELCFEAGCDDGDPLYEVRLVDYDGSCVTVDGHPVRRTLAARVRRADAVLCVLDGARVAALLDGDRASFDHTMSGVWKLAASRGKVVRFVVTKWDLLEGRATLAQVRDALVGVPGFVAAARRSSGWRNAPGSVGLIPVSVVGEEPGRQAVVPLLSVLAPVLRVAAERARRTGRGGSAAAEVGVNWLAQAVTAEAVRRVLHRLVGEVPEGRGARRYAGHAAVGASMLVEAAVRTWSDRALRPAHGQAARARSLRRAAEACQWELDGFRRTFPASTLHGVVSSLPTPLRRRVG